MQTYTKENLYNYADIRQEALPEMKMDIHNNKDVNPSRIYQNLNLYIYLKV